MSSSDDSVREPSTDDDFLLLPYWKMRKHRDRVCDYAPFKIPRRGITKSGRDRCTGYQVLSVCKECHRWVNPLQIQSPITGHRCRGPCRSFSSCSTYAYDLHCILPPEDVPTFRNYVQSVINTQPKTAYEMGRSNESFLAGARELRTKYHEIYLAGARFSVQFERPTYVSTPPRRNPIVPNSQESNETTRSPHEASTAGSDNLPEGTIAAAPRGSKPRDSKSQSYTQFLQGYSSDSDSSWSSDSDVSENLLLCITSDVE